MTLCDSHIHVVGDPASYRLIPDRTYTPGVATIEDAQSLGAPHGITRFVIVQPSFYGTDNTLMVETLAKLGDRGRGVAVLDPAAAAASDLAALHAAGIRGLRINLYSAHGSTPGSLADRFTPAAAVAQAMGWHVQVIAPLPVLADASDLLAAAPVPVVVDHYGLPGGHRPDGPQGRRLLALLRHGHVWMKLSAPYRSTGDALGVVPDPAWLSAILDAAASRCVWGSDWPHTPAHENQVQGGAHLPYRQLDYRRLVLAFRDAMPSAGLANAIMGDNAARLYDFPA